MTGKISNTVEHLSLIFSSDSEAEERKGPSSELGVDYADLFATADCFKRISLLEIEIYG